MKTKIDKPNHSAQAHVADASPTVRKAYSPAQLCDLGDVRDVTLGGSPGLGDSGAELSEDPP